MPELRSVYSNTQDSGMVPRSTLMLYFGPAPCAQTGSVIGLVRMPDRSVHVTVTVPSLRLGSEPWMKPVKRRMDWIPVLVWTQRFRYMGVPTAPIVPGQNPLYGENIRHTGVPSATWPPRVIWSWAPEYPSVTSSLSGKAPVSWRSMV